MAKNSNTTVRQFLHGLFGRAYLARLCRESGFQKRRSKVIPEQFLLCAVLHVGANLQRILDRFMLCFSQVIARSSFYERISNLGLHKAVASLLDELQKRANQRRLPSPVRRAIGGFADVVALDSTVVVLRDGLEGHFPGTRKQYRAAAKIFTAIRVLTGELLHHKIAPECTNDVGMFCGLPVTRKRLYLLDMGFSAVWLWKQFADVDAYFLTRLRVNFRPTISAGKYAGKQLREVLARRGMKRNAEFWCDFHLRTPPWGTKTGQFERLRVVALFDHDEGKHHLYVTNASAHLLPRRKVRQFYALRWQIELNYKLAKGQLGLKNITSTSPAVVRCLVQTALVRCSCAMQAKLLADAELPKQRWICAQRWAAVWAEALPLAIAGQRITFKLLAAITTDPNRKRIPACQSAFPQLLEGT